MVILYMYLYMYTSDECYAWVHLYGTCWPASSDKMQNENCLLTVGFEPTALRSEVWYFQHVTHDQTFYQIWYLHVKSKHRTCASLCYLNNIAISQYVTQKSTFSRQNTLHFIILERIPMCTYIQWYRKYMLVEHQTSDLMVIETEKTNR